LAGKYTLTSDEAVGSLFKGKANCNSCHLDGRSTALTPGETDTGAAANTRPLFTCFGYANEGLPLNPRVALFYQTMPDRFGFTPNPYGFGYRDLGLGAFSEALQSKLAMAQFAPTSDGKCKPRPRAMCDDTAAVSHQRGARTLFPERVLPQWLYQEPQAARPFLQYARCVSVKVTSGHCPEGRPKGGLLPMPEVPNNIDMTVGNLGLTDQEETRS